MKTFWKHTRGGEDREGPGDTAPPGNTGDARDTITTRPGPPRRRRARPKLFRLLLVGFVFPVLAGGAVVWWAFTSEAGTRWALRTAASLHGGSITFGGVRGTLGRELELRDVQFASKTSTITAARVAFAWHPRALLSRRLDVDRIEADSIAMVSTAAEEKKEPLELSEIHLPVNVIVRQARITGLAMSGPGPEPPFVIDSIELSTSSLGDTVHVSKLAVRSPQFLLDASGDVTPVGDYPVNLRLAWSSVRGDGSPLAGSGTLTGTLERLKVRHELTLPVLACADATLKAPMRSLEFDGDLELDAARLKDVDPTLPEVVLGGRLHAKGKPEAFTASGDLLTRAQDLSPVTAKFQVERDGDEWLIRAADLGLPPSPGVVALKGRVSLAEKDPRFELKGEWREIVWPPGAARASSRSGSSPAAVTAAAGATAVATAEPRLAPVAGAAAKALARSPRGTLSVTGTAADYALELTADLSGEQIPPGRWSLKGRGDREKLKLEWVRSTILGGNLNGAGTLSWKPELRWQLALSGQRLDPRTFAPEWPGELTFTAATSGTRAARGFVARLEVSKLEGTLRGQRVSGATLIDVDGEETFIRKLDLTSGTAKVAVSGRMGRQWALTYDVKAPNLAALVPRSAGELVAEGSIHGPRSALGVSAKFSGKSLAFDANRVASLEGSADVNLGRDGKLAIDAAASGVKYGERTVDAIHVSGDGTRARHRIGLAATGAGAANEKKSAKRSLDLALDGGLEGRTWRGSITQLDLASPETGAWRLDGPASLVAAPDAVALSNLKWSSADSHLLASGSWKNTGASSVDARLDHLPLALLGPFLPPNTKLTGTVDGHAIASTTAEPGSLNANVEIRPSPGEIRYPAPEGRVAVVAYRDGAFVLQAKGGNLGAKGGIAIADGRLEVDVTVSGSGDVKSRALAGTIRASFPDLAFSQAFIPGTWQVSGALAADMKLSGTAGRPRATGEASLKGGQANLPDYGLELREISVVARGREDGHLVLDGSVRSGTGRATLTGDVNLAPNTPAKLAIRGERFQVMHNEEGNVLVSPKLDVLVQGKRIDVTGDVEVPEARIVQEKKKFATVEPSKDIVFVGVPAEPPKTSAEIHTRVRIVLSDRVRFKGQGFDTKIEGTLLAVDEPGRATTGTGELWLKEGTYKAYGQDLTIEHGRAVFAGPIGDPALDAQAYRTAKDGTVAGIYIKGTLRAPEVTLYSDPAMAQSEALAYLLLGHPLGQSTEKEGSLVANAAASLGLKGGNMLAKKIATRFGLEEARIEAKDGYESASLVVGKYFSPRFYVQYGVGLFDRVSTIRVNYVLSKKWTVRAETGTGNAADIFYTVDSRTR